MAPRPTRLFLEMHFCEDVSDGDDDLDAFPEMAVHDQLGNAMGTTHVVGVEYPEPHIVRVELELADMVIAGVDSGEDDFA